MIAYYYLYLLALLFSVLTQLCYLILSRVIYILKIFINLQFLVNFKNISQHINPAVNGTKWYEFFGAGEKQVKLSAEGSWIPVSITLLIALVLFSWGFYAFSGLKLVVKLPFLTLVLQVIAGIYLVRGLVVIPIFIIDRKKVNWFVVWSSTLSFIFGLFYFFGVVSMK